MSVAIPNYNYKYMRRGKPVFAPSGVGRRIGAEIKEAIEAAYQFDSSYFHLRSGGHVAAMHHHRDHHHFARIDITRFFYSISRRRVQSAMDRIGVGNAGFYAKWSTVVNPFKNPQYALPYGFVQSPILATLVMATSAVGEHLANIPDKVNVSVYVDDISFSSDDLSMLQSTFSATIQVLEQDGFSVSHEKIRPPASSIDIFNCDLLHGNTAVTNQRIEKFFENVSSQESEDAFIAYCASVEAGNI